ncbi:formylglycine-generating enzyme family protein [Aggregicoccus sp. 17bor-14]|uniref:formylglycine-generating enzyme family protein n=1 Tax=Myxococcaceae TaxID=31 RepID=UPI00129C2424|nr:MULTISPECIES: SUMF1/EgtB/PvdO family nonheme iron enzyme [Myxococcaceae]MBF5044491.1 SUMF1/EgtB/PvdO family nonheme iron enzyme [Simulacricoccus sp. 17bor-14]MRI90236.1 formylglycine-generating enzyme family protein [Aggregicoccus sp. 17bor-14]
MSPADLAASEAVTAPVVFAKEPPASAPGRPLPLVAQFPQAAGAAGGPPLLEPAPENATYQLHSSMLPPSLGPSDDGAVTEMLPAFALPFQFSKPEAPAKPLPRPEPPGPPLSERLGVRRPAPRLATPPRLRPRRPSVELPPLFANQLPRNWRKKPAKSPAAAPEASSFFASQAEPERTSVPLVVLAVAGLVLGLGGGYWLMQGRREPEVPAPAAAAAPTPVPAKPAPPAPARPAAPAAPPTKVVRASLEGDDVEPASLVAAMKPKPGAPPLTVVRAEAHDGPGGAPLSALAVPASGSCPAGMRRVPGGTFAAGSPPEERGRGLDERALAPRTVAAFCIDEYEYPNRPGTAPAVTVSWEEAQRACGMLGKRLCAEDEWEKACKGPSGQRYPYGNAFDSEACNTEDAKGQPRTVAAAGRAARCRSGYGVADLSGNVAEWTATPLGADRVVKGGTFDRAEAAARCAARKNGAPAARSATVGFRCCADAL